MYPCLVERFVWLAFCSEAESKAVSDKSGKGEITGGKKFQFAIVGAGWRAAFYFQIARALLERFHVCAAVEPDETCAAAAKAAWGWETVPEIGGPEKDCKA